MRTILLLGATAPLFLALAIAVLLRVLADGFLVDTTLLEGDLPFPVRLDLSLLSATLPLPFAFGLIVASSYVVSLTLTLLILHLLNFVRKFFLILFQFRPYLMYNP